MQISRLKGLLFPELDEEESRENKIRQLKRMVQNDEYVTDEKLDAAIAKLLDEIEHE